MATEKQLKNLKSYKKGEMTHEQAVSAGRLGGIKSQQKKKERKQMCDLLREYLNQASEVYPGKTVGEEYIAAVVAQMLCNPSTKDLESITRILGELVQKQSIDLDAEVKAEVKEVFELPDGSK